jgi:hypothetical protein
MGEYNILTGGTIIHFKIPGQMINEVRIRKFSEVAFWEAPKASHLEFPDEYQKETS